MDIHLTEDEMAEIKKDVLIKLRHYLCDKIIADRHFDYLRSRRILTRDDTEEINGRSTQRKKTGMLLDILAENPRGLDALIESVQLCHTLNFIITKITDEVQKAKNEKIEALRASSSSSCYNPTSSADFSRTFSNESTMLFHPDGEGTPPTSGLGGSFNMPSASFMGQGSMPASTSTASTSLPKPGDPGAPPLPEELLDEVSSSSNAEASSHGGPNSGGDAVFQPLRSRSLTPTSHKDSDNPSLSKHQ